MSTKESGLLLGLDDSYCSRQTKMEITFKDRNKETCEGRERRWERGWGTGNGNRDGGWGHVITRKEMTAALTGNG